MTKIVKIDNEEVTLNLCDTVGQEQFDSLPKSYITHSNVCLFVYDVSNRNSFDAIQHWGDDYKNLSDKTIESSVVLVGNKSDVEDAQRVVSKEEGEKLANEMKVKFFECSSLNGNGIEDIFNEVVELIKSQKSAAPALVEEKKDEAVDLKEDKKEKKGCC